MKWYSIWTYILPLMSLSYSTPLTKFSEFGEFEPANYLATFREKRQSSEICDFGFDNDPNSCDWNNRNGSSLRWEFGAGTLSNWVGGPPKDANDDSKGGYMFFETSLLPPDPRLAHSAFLESSELPTTTAEGKCIAFSYAIEGLSFAGLRVLIHPVPNGDDEEQYIYDRVLWSSKDSTQKEWKKAEILYFYNEDHEIIFEAVAKDLADPLRRFRGYIAIDNVARKPGIDCRGHCTFEGGFCTWFNEEGDDFQWSLGRGSINPSTGPATDRSSSLHGGMEGGYAYIDSSYPRKPGDIAVLSSEDFEATAMDKPLCLRFWVHMFGSGIGHLSVIINDKDEGTDTELWSLSGESGNFWRQAEIPIFSQNTFRILIVGQVGKNQMGNIAIDDISLMPGTCPIAPQEAAIIPGDCSFEDDECGWMNANPREKADDFDWERIKGTATRPIIEDHTLGTNNGYFLTLVNGNLQRPGSRAVMLGKEIRNQKEPRCMSFWYIMNEPYMESPSPSLGSLKIFAKTFDRLKGQILTPKWQLYNHQGPDWKFAQVYFEEVNYTVRTQLETKDINYEILIEGTWGTSKAEGLIAIDDITFYKGKCSILPKEAYVHKGDCHFDRDTCGWILEESKTPISPSWKLAISAQRPANLPDKTFGADEGYVYFDLFNHNADLNMVNFISPLIPANPEQYCMTFWFAAFGAGEDAQLKIIKLDNSTNNENPSSDVWSLQAKDLDTQRPIWIPGQVTFEASYDFIIVLEGKATNGGFAIDDVMFYNGTCTTRPDSAKVKQQDESNY